MPDPMMAAHRQPPAPHPAPHPRPPPHPTPPHLTPHPTADDYRQEQLDYFSKTAAWTDVHPSQVVGSAACFKAYDLHTVTLEELKAPLKVGGWGGARGARGVGWLHQGLVRQRAVEGFSGCWNGCHVAFRRLQARRGGAPACQPHPCPPPPPPLPQASFQMRVLEDGPVDAFCGWFDTQFKGSAENATTTEVTLSTAPDPTGATHWGQQVRRKLGPAGAV